MTICLCSFRRFVIILSRFWIPISPVYFNPPHLLIFEIFSNPLFIRTPRLFETWGFLGDKTLTTMLAKLEKDTLLKDKEITTRIIVNENIPFCPSRL